MSKQNKIWTFRDLDSSPRRNNDPGDRSHEMSNNVATSAGSRVPPASKDAGGSPEALKACHIPSLPNADTAKELLHRVVREFETIARQRGYNVKSVSEMCCCNDGLDFESGRRTKIRKQSANIWGYNQTTWYGGRKSHTIHLRLRHANNHGRFHLYEDVAGTMAHELAHCEHGPHNQKFYKLMDEILEQHAVLMASKLSKNGHSMPAFAGQGFTLGGTTTATVASGGGKSRLLSHPGHKLGGDSEFTQWMSPAEAAVVAAEARRRQQQLRLRGDRCCRPCIIRLDEEDDDENNENEKKARTNSPDLAGNELSTNNKLKMKRPSSTDDLKPSGKKANRKQQTGTPTNSTPLIDLTTSEQEDPSKGSISALVSGTEWACLACTFRNAAGHLQCSICQTERNLTASR